MQSIESGSALNKPGSAKRGGSGPRRRAVPAAYLESDPGQSKSPVSRTRWFPAFSRKLAAWAGRGTTFVIAVVLILAWAISGPLFDFSDTWQLVINTGTTVVTFLMVFLIQNTQNRDTQALQIKLDELIRAVKGGHNALLDLEEMSEEELETHHQQYVELARVAKEQVRRGESDGDCPELDVAAVAPEKPSTAS